MIESWYDGGGRDKFWLVVGTDVLLSIASV